MKARRAGPLNGQMCAMSIARVLAGRLVQELRDTLQQQQATQQTAASAEEQAQTARCHQQEHAEENAALKHEIQVKLSLSVLVILCGRGRELANTSRIPQRRDSTMKAQTSGAGIYLYDTHIEILASVQRTTMVCRLCSRLQRVHSELCELTLSLR